MARAPVSQSSSSVGSGSVPPLEVELLLLDELEELEPPEDELEDELLLDEDEELLLEELLLEEYWTTGTGGT